VELVEHPQDIARSGSEEFVRGQLVAAVAIYRTMMGGEISERGKDEPPIISLAADLGADRMPAKKKGNGTLHSAH
jgi:hypothetical protein